MLAPVRDRRRESPCHARASRDDRWWRAFRLSTRTPLGQYGQDVPELAEAWSGVHCDGMMETRIIMRI